SADEVAQDLDVAGTRRRHQRRRSSREAGAWMRLGQKSARRRAGVGDPPERPLDDRRRFMVRRIAAVEQVPAARLQPLELELEGCLRYPRFPAGVAPDREDAAVVGEVHVERILRLAHAQAFSAPWKTASTLLPSGSRTYAP